MGIELAKAFVTIAADASQLKGDLQDVKQMVGAELLNAPEMAHKIFERLSEAAKNFLERGMEVSDHLEVIETELRQMTGSGEKAEEMMAGLSKFSRTSAMDIPSLYHMSRQLIMVGESSEQVVDTLKLLGDASGGTEEKFKTLAHAYQSMQTGTASFQFYFRTLSRQGIVTTQDLARHFKTTEAAAKKMANTGKVTFEDFKEVLKEMTGESGRMKDALEEQADTCIRLAAAYKNAVDMLAKMLYQPLDPYLKEFNKGLIQIIYALTDFVKWGGKGLSFMFAGVAGLGALAGAAGIAAAALWLLSIPLAVAAAWILPIIGLVAAVIAIGAAIGALAYLIDLPGMIAAAWKWLLSVLERSGVYEVINNLLDIWDRLWDVVSLVCQSIWNALKPLVGWIGGAGDTMIVGWTKFWMDIGKGMTNFVLDGLEWMQVFLENWNVTRLAMGLGFMATSLIMRDVFNNALDAMVDHTSDSVRKMITEFIMLGTEIAMAFQPKTYLVPGVADAMRAQARDSIEGVLKNVPGLGGPDNNKGLLDQSQETKDFIKSSGLEGMLEILQSKKDEFEGKRRNNQNLSGGGGFGGKEKEEPEPSKDKAGIYGIAAFGKKIQESLLNPKDKMIGIAEAGNAIAQRQADLLVEIRDKRDNGLA